MRYALTTARIWRIACILFLLGWTSISFSQQALASDSPCPWVKPNRPPSIALYGQELVVVAPYSSAWAQCLGKFMFPKIPEFQVNIYLGNTKGELLLTDRLTMSPDANDEQTYSIISMSANRYCDSQKVGQSLQTAKKTLDEQGRVMGQLPLVAEIIGEGELSKLNATLRLDVFCPACQRDHWSSTHHGGPKLDSTTGVFKVQLYKDWYECARYNSTLEIRLFTPGGDQDIKKKLKPEYIVNNLDKKFTLKEDTATFEFSLLSILPPIEQLCKETPHHSHTRVAYEFIGQGQLKTFTYQTRREEFSLRCPVRVR